MTALAWAAALLALLPLLLGLRNLRLFRVPREPAPEGCRVSILIPARDEAANIGEAVAAALASVEVEVEVVVLDDQSSDQTASIVRRLAQHDPRVRLVVPPPLPPGWAGKQRACRLLADQARHEVLMFIDADVRLAPEAASRAAGFLLREANLGLVSGFPRETTGSIGEHLVIPWIHVLLLGYLPMDFMRHSRRPAFGAGCGQWMVARRDAYFEVGGHGAAPASRHDGVSLPRSFRAAGWGTDLFDATPLARCRMYRGFREVWDGFGKSAGEGLATPVGLPVWTLLIAGGHLLPWLLLPLGLVTGQAQVMQLAALGIAANLVLRVLLAWRFGQHPVGVALHAVGGALVLALNGAALRRHVGGRPSLWRGRAYVGGRRIDPAEPGASVSPAPRRRSSS
ncbi:glycosyltransferase [Methylibium sp.]|uniref:glycosyltransferase family 2 protein n=1 Tax=Methylibium sp. TaxID=2067992 RepID=UPI0017F3B497|nr:glycosyltransferase [Methylibium sp.]MBA3589331.1 glycosyltransferase [Methylibium sp.]